MLLASFLTLVVIALGVDVGVLRVREQSSDRLEGVLEPAQLALFERAGWLARSDIQFHWHDRGYRSFDDFLGRLSSRKRKAIRKERQSAQDSVDIQRFSGSKIRAEHWDAFWLFYQDTGARKWGQPYLTREAFDLFGERMGERGLPRRAAVPAFRAML